MYLGLAKLIRKYKLICTRRLEMKPPLAARDVRGALSLEAGTWRAVLFRSTGVDSAVARVAAPIGNITL
jgi:hypothetical protein